MEKINIKDKVTEFIETAFGTKGKLKVKFAFSCLISGTLFYIFSYNFKDHENALIHIIFGSISGILFSLWLIIISGIDTLIGLCKEYLRLVICFLIFYFSLYFCFIYCINIKNTAVFIILSILSCTGLLICSFYFVSKFIDILKGIKDILKKVTEKLFDSIQPSNSKIIGLIENITAFLVSITGFAVALRTIIVPIINVFNSL